MTQSNSFASSVDALLKEIVHVVMDGDKSHKVKEALRHVLVKHKADMQSFHNKHSHQQESTGIRHEWIRHELQRDPKKHHSSTEIKGLERECQSLQHILSELAESMFSKSSFVSFETWLQPDRMVTSLVSLWFLR